MGLDVFVNSPKNIRSLAEVDKVLEKIDAYEKQMACRAGVLLIQRRQFGALYMISSEEEALKDLAIPILGNIPEFAIQFYTKIYFEALRDKLQGRETRFYAPLTFTIERKS